MTFWQGEPGVFSFMRKFETTFLTKWERDQTERTISKSSQCVECIMYKTWISFFGKCILFSLFQLHCQVNYDLWSPVKDRSLFSSTPRGGVQENDAAGTNQPKSADRKCKLWLTRMDRVAVLQGHRSRQGCNSSLWHDTIAITRAGRMGSGGSPCFIAESGLPVFFALGSLNVDKVERW